jgi:hypothetical protein
LFCFITLSITYWLKHGRSTLYIKTADRKTAVLLIFQSPPTKTLNSLIVKSKWRFKMFIFYIIALKTNSSLFHQREIPSFLIPRILSSITWSYRTISRPVLRNARNPGFYQTYRYTNNCFCFYICSNSWH